MRSLLIVSLVVATILPAISAEAQRGTSQREVQQGDTATARQIAPVVVVDHITPRGYSAPASSRASKLVGPLRDLPQSIGIVGRALIADQSMQNMADVVRYIPGIGMAQGEGHRDAPVIRGNTSTADFFVDGVRDDGQYLRDLYDVERVEALKGSNAMAFGRGGGGGVINRVTKSASWAPTREFTVEGGSFQHRRATLDIGGEVTAPTALRLTGMFERSNLFRDGTSLERSGVHPTAAFVLGGTTTLRLGAERFADRRTVDRGVPSFAGAPVASPVQTFFGDPDVSRASSVVLAGNVGLEHRTTGGITLRNRTNVAQYDKWYQNVFPGAVNDAGTMVQLRGYRSDIVRNNLLNQTEAALSTTHGIVRQHLLAGVELGAQRTSNFRRTGYFGGSATTTSAALDHPTVSTPVEFRQSATDADNNAKADVAGGYLQDQVEFGSHLQAVVGLRLDRFAIHFRNHRDSSSLSRSDRTLSPRVGLVFKPVTPLSIYAAYSVSHLPSSGDQFSSLTPTTVTLEPEQFVNREVGVKWDALANLAFTAAAYRLDRSNTTAPDPFDASRVVQTGRQRSSGLELGVSGDVTTRWQVQGGLAEQRAVIVERTAAALAGARVPLVPRHTASLWNRYQLTSTLGAGLGVIHQSASFAAIDNSVRLPAYTRADAALFVVLGDGVRTQFNLENLFDVRYFASSQGNNNIMPGAPRAVRISITLER